MPPQTQKVSLLGKLGKALVAAHQKVKDNETEFDTQGGLPAGIENGIAQVVECKFDQYKEGDNKGQFFFYAAAVVVAPDEVNGIPIKGLRTSIMEPLCATPSRSRKTIEDHLDWIYNELRKMGVDTSSLSPDDLESTAQAVKESGVHIRFRTWQGKPSEQYPDPRVNHVWNGTVEWDGGDDQSNQVNDNSNPDGDVYTDADPETVVPHTQENLSHKKTGPKPGPKPGMKKKAEPEPEPAQELGQEQLTELAEAADGGDTDATEKLQEILMGEYSVSEQTIESAGSWAELVEGVMHPVNDTNPGDLELGDVYLYSPIDPKTKKPVKKPIECEVIGVDSKKHVVKLKNMDDGKTIYQNVPFDSLQTI